VGVQIPTRATLFRRRRRSRRRRRRRSTTEAEAEAEGDEEEEDEEAEAEAQAQQKQKQKEKEKKRTKKKKTNWIRPAPKDSGLRPQLDSVVFPPHMRSVKKGKKEGGKNVWLSMGDVRSVLLF
jgi:regulator of protease activity HflC (stomatin/prohibitin superfamily)